MDGINPVLNYLFALICVIALSAGQVLFKAAAVTSKESNGFLATKPLGFLIAAMFIYAAASLLWVWVLRSEELGRVYPFMALAFVIVPVASLLVFGERFSTDYFIGLGLIIAGIVFTTRS